jgi:hypothetical protein
MLTILTAWFLVSLPAGILVGKFIKHASCDAPEPLPFVPGREGRATGDLGVGVNFHATANSLGGQ